MGRLALILHQITGPIIHKSGISLSYYDVRLALARSQRALATFYCGAGSYRPTRLLVNLSALLLSHLHHWTSYPITTLGWIDGVTCSFLLVLLRRDNPETVRNKYFYKFRESP